MKKTICLILALVLCLCLFAGCGKTQEETPAPVQENNDTSSENLGGVNTGGSSTEGFIATPPPAESEYYDTLTLIIGDKVAVIDPFNPASNTSQTGIINHMIYDTLIDYTIDGKYEPCLATEWSTDDYKTFTFKLREGVKFHNGEPFTSDDVLFTFTRALDATGTSVYDKAKVMEKIECPDDYTVVITLTAENYDFYYDAANILSSVIVNREAYDADPDNAGKIGTGPYSIKEFVANDSITFERNDDYFGAAPYTKTFVMRYIAEETARYIMLENDEADFVGVNGDYIAKYAEQYQMNSYLMNNCNYVAFNCQKGVTADVNFRKAVAYALDKQGAVDYAIGGYGQLHDTGVMWGNTSAYKNTNIPMIEQDLEKAKEYLAASSYKGEKVTIAAGMAQTQKAAEVFMNNLIEIGIDAEVLPLDGPTLTSRTIYGSNDLDLIVNSAPWTPLASSINVMLLPGSNSNKANYENAEITELINKATSTPDGEERQAMYYRIQEIMAEEMPYAATHHMALYTAGQPGTGGALYFATNYHDYSMAYRIKG